LGKLKFRTNEKITYHDLKNGIDNLNATQNFSAINYIINKEDGYDNLEFKFTENPIKTFLKFGLHYDGLYKSGILLNLTQKNLFYKNDVVSLDVILGDNFRYNLDYYIDNGFYFSFGVKSRLNQFNRNIIADKSGKNVFEIKNYNSINLDFLDFSNQVYLQTIFKQKFIIGGGLELKHIKIKSANIQSTTPIFENTDYGNIYGYLKFDSLDNLYFPKKGWYFNGDFQSYVYASKFVANFQKYSVVKADFGFARNFYKKATILFQTEGGFAVGEQTVPYFDFVLGGYGFNKINNFKGFYGYDFLSLSGDSYMKSTFTLDYEILKKNHLNFAANYANIGNNMFDNTKNWFKKPQYSGYAVGYGLETIIGPVEVKYSWSPELNKGFTWFSVGFWF
jgi:NTE family protein